MMQTYSPNLFEEALHSFHLNKFLLLSRLIIINCICGIFASVLTFTVESIQMKMKFPWFERNYNGIIQSKKLSEVTYFAIKRLARI